MSAAAKRCTCCKSPSDDLQEGTYVRVENGDVMAFVLCPACMRRSKTDPNKVAMAIRAAYKAAVAASLN
jgi:hypothetical protein